VIQSPPDGVQDGDAAHVAEPPKAPVAPATSKKA